MAGSFCKKFIFEFTFFAIVLAAFYVLRVCLTWQLPVVQLFLFPLFTVFLLILNIRRRYFSNLVLILGVCGACVACISPYLGKKSVFVATLTDDDVEAESRAFWDELNKSFSLYGENPTKRFYRTFDSHVEALATVGDQVGQALIWGDKRWVKVSFKQQPIYNFFGFKLVGGVQVLPVPYQPRFDTAKFIATLLSAMNHIEPDGKLTFQAETALNYLVSRQSLWLAAFHKGVPHLLLGNGYLLAAYQNGSFQESYINCALAHYRRALLYSDLKGSPELYKVINNNLAVALYVKGRTTGQKQLVKQAKLFFRNAFNKRIKLNGLKLVVNKIAKENLASTQIDYTIRGRNIK